MPVVFSLSFFSQLSTILYDLDTSPCLLLSCAGDHLCIPFPSYCLSLAFAFFKSVFNHSAIIAQLFFTAHLIYTTSTHLGFWTRVSFTPRSQYVIFYIQVPGMLPFSLEDRILYNMAIARMADMDMPPVL